MKRVLLLLLLLQLALVSYGGISLPSIFSNNMVLQQKTNVKIWGWAEPGETLTITTSWSKKNYITHTGPDGNWSLFIRTPGQRSGEKLCILSRQTGDKIEISNILIGEVWLASGQSNMEFEMSPHPEDKWMTGMTDWEMESQDANYPNIHLFKIEEKWDHNTPLEDCNGEWIVSSPEVARNFSAIAFLFARELHKRLEAPVGVILCAFGGTHAESWTRLEAMQNDTIYNKVFKGYAPNTDVCKKYPHKVPAAIWNAMVNPIVGYTIKGNVWYQAESNAWRASDYPSVFVNMVNDWRLQWKQKRLPFYFMQVAPFGTMPGEIRREQAKIWENKMVDDIYMATAIDVGDSLDIHPQNKIVPAKRLLLPVLAKEYGKSMECFGPLYKRAQIDQGKVIISFRNSKGLHFKTNDGKFSTRVLQADYLCIYGPDGIAHKAYTSIENEKLVVWSPNVTEPAEIKYCTDNYCKGFIYNGAGLPAYPFEIKLR